MSFMKRCTPEIEIFSPPGHLPGLALSGLRYVGRGFAAQQLIEEWNSRRALSAKVRQLGAAQEECHDPLLLPLGSGMWHQVISMCKIC